MLITTPKEVIAGERRVALTPKSATELQSMGYDCAIEAGAGLAAGFADADYERAGVEIIAKPDDVWARADVVIKIRAPEPHETSLFRAEQTLICLFSPHDNKAGLEAASAALTNVVAMEMIPRISRAQGMDVLSSMANIAGYRAVIEAGNNFGRFFTGQVTAAGKIPPARVLVIGAGVAGLAAVGTSVSLGAITYAFDVRPEVAEQIQSMGAEFVFLNFEANSDDATDDTAQDSGLTGGYAAPSSPEFKAKQLEKFSEMASQTDIVITTALIAGRDAPLLWTKEMVASMPAGSVVIDLAAERGGNCELTVADEKIVTDNDVTIIGYTDFPSRMASQASTLYATNVRNLIKEMTPNSDGVISYDMEDDVIRSATAVYDGKVVYPPAPLKVKAIASPLAARKQPSPEEIKATEAAQQRASAIKQVSLIIVGSLVTLAVGTVAPASFMQHFIVFVLACFIGFQVIWNVSHSLHTPLMSVTNAISGIIVVGALLQMTSESWLVITFAAIASLIAVINITGGFMVTRRMLLMFVKS